MTCSRGQSPAAAPPVDHFSALAPHPFVPSPQPIAPPPAPLAPFGMEPAPGHDAPPRYQQYQGHQKSRGQQHYKRCDKSDDLGLGIRSRGEVIGTGREYPPVAVTGPRVASVVAAPFDPAPAPAQPVYTPVAAPMDSA